MAPEVADELGDEERAHARAARLYLAAASQSPKWVQYWVKAAGAAALQEDASILTDVGRRIVEAGVNRSWLAGMATQIRGPAALRPAAADRWTTGVGVLASDRDL